MNCSINKQISTKNAFIFIFIFCLLYALPIILADIYYRDDMERVLNPAAGWFTSGRPSADFIMRLFTFNFFEITDTAPLTLLIGVLFISWVIWSVAIKIEYQLNIGSISPYILLLISPFFLQNISYKYDSLPMIVGLGLSILAFFYPKDRGIKSYLIPILFLFIALTLYQPCTNIFLGLYGVNLLIGFKEKGDTPLKETLWAGIVLLSAYVIYFIIINKLLGLNGGRGELITLDKSGFYFSKDIDAILKFISFSITRELKLIIYISSICVVYVSALRIYDFIKKNHWGSVTLLSLMMILISPLIIFISFLGPLFLLKEGVTDIRVLPGLSATLFLFGYSLYITLKKINPKLVFLTLIPVIYFITVSFQYGNAIKSQRVYEERIFSWLTYDLINVQANYRGKIFINNYPNTSPITQNIINHQPLLELMYTPAYGWISRRIVFSMGINNVDLGWGDTYPEFLKGICAKSIKPLKENKFYAIYPSGDNTVVWLKNKFKKMCE